MVAPMIGRFHVRFGLWHTFWGVTSVLHIFHFVLACPICMPVLNKIGCSRTTDRVVPLLNGGPGCCSRRHHPAPHRMSFDKRPFFLASKTTELSLLLGYGRSHYICNWTDVMNTIFW